MILFEELMQAADFRSAADGLGGEFRKRFALPPLHQLGLVVPDVEQASRELEAGGIGPFLIVGGSVDSWQERGEGRSFTGKMGIAYHQGLEVELLEPGVGSDFYRQHIDSGGRAVVQHLGFLVQDVDVWAAIVSQAGHPVWVKGDMSAWPARTRFTYMDTVEETGFVMEFISWSLLGIRFSPVAGLFHLGGRIQKGIGVRSFYFR